VICNKEQQMPKSEDLSFAAIKVAANSSMPVPPVGSNHSRVGLVASGNPDVLAEAVGKTRGSKLKSGPAWEEGVRNGTQVQHTPGKKDLQELGRGKPITY
jgi:hypothetical protein